MKVQIATEAGEFLRETGLSARKLALEAEINPVILTRVIAGTRKDMSSRYADALRAAMQRLSAQPPITSHPQPQPQPQSEAS